MDGLADIALTDGRIDLFGDRIAGFFSGLLRCLGVDGGLDDNLDRLASDPFFDRLRDALEGGDYLKSKCGETYRRHTQTTSLLHCAYCAGFAMSAAVQPRSLLLGRYPI